jgi:cytochrome c oxidase cbb3-type subunit IV
MIMGLVTALLILVFFGIVGWAYSARRSVDFAEAAQLPLHDREPRA